MTWKKNYKKKQKIKKKLILLEKDLNNLNNCKSPPNFQKNTAFLWSKNYFTLRVNNKKNILVYLSEETFLRNLNILEIHLNIINYKKNILNKITKK